jgi:hypothetical protein
MKMDSQPTTQSLRGLSVGSIAFGVLGGAFFWWVPLGMVFGLAGLILGLVDWVSARRRSADYRLAIVAVAALALDIAVAFMGMQSVTFGELR